MFLITCSTQDSNAQVFDDFLRLIFKNIRYLMSFCRFRSKNKGKRDISPKCINIFLKKMYTFQCNIVLFLWKCFICIVLSYFLAFLSHGPGPGPGPEAHGPGALRVKRDEVASVARFVTESSPTLCTAAFQGEVKLSSRHCASSTFSTQFQLGVDAALQARVHTKLFTQTPNTLP